MHSAVSRAVRALAAPALCLLLGAPAWPRQVDDQYITLAFAHNLVETGEVIWNTGDRVEGTSSLLQLALAALAILAGLDAGLFVKLLAAASGLGLLATAGWRLGHRPAGALLVLALAAWEPLSWWSLVGMETTLFAALLTVGWISVVGGGRAWIPALLSATMCRPEGVALLGLACVARRNPWPLLAGVLLHAGRAAYFGAALPAPFLVKVSASGDPLFPRLGQLGWEGISLAGVGAAVTLGYRPRSAWVWAPLLLETAVEVATELDWMGHARYLLPGVCATALSWAWTGEERALPVPTRAGLAALATGAGLWVAPSVESPGLKLRPFEAIAEPFTFLRAGLDTPQWEDVKWIVERAPANGAVYIADVGMPGNIPFTRLYDLAGLTSRAVAENFRQEDIGTQNALYEAGRGSRLVRVLQEFDGPSVRPPDWLRAAGLARVKYPQGWAWRLAEGQAPDAALVLERWRRLHERYPSQGPIRAAYAYALAGSGDWAGAARVATEGADLFPGDAMLERLPAHLFRGTVLDDKVRQVSQALPTRFDAAIRVQIEPTDHRGQRVEYRWSCEPTWREVSLSDAARIPVGPAACPGEASATIQVRWKDDRPRRPAATWMRVTLAG